MKKNIISYLIMFMLVATASFGDGETKELSKWEKHWFKRVKVFERENSKLKNVVFVGDSLTEGFDLKKYFPDQPTLNRGIVSDHIPGVLRRLDNSVFDCNPRAIFIMIGVNDIGDLDRDGSTSLEKMEKQYREIIKTLKEKTPDLRVYIESCLPAGSRFAKLNPYIEEFNQTLKKIAKENDFPYIDLYPDFLDDKRELKKDLTREGLHLKEEGYQIWAEKLLPYLTELEAKVERKIEIKLD